MFSILGKGRNLFAFYSPAVLELKLPVLNKRIVGKSLLSAGAALLPVISLGIDLGIIIKESKFYEEQLGLRDEDLQNLAFQAKVGIDGLKAKIPTYLKGPLTLKSLSKIVVTLGSAGVVVGVGLAAETLLGFLCTMPLVGTAVGAVVGAPVSLITMYFLLHRILEDLVKARTLIWDEVKEHLH